MPSMMIHLLAAKKARPSASPLFLIGNLAPDGVNIREIKDKSHYRDILDRDGALRDLALSARSQDDYGAGVLLHLFLDWKWDEVAFVPFKAQNEQINPDWFKEYRRQISLASTWLFHHCDWADRAGSDMLNIEMSQFGSAEGVTPQDVSAYLQRTVAWHRENDTEASPVFSPDFVEQFVEDAVNAFYIWHSGVQAMRGKI